MKASVPWEPPHALSGPCFSPSSEFALKKEMVISPSPALLYVLFHSHTHSDGLVGDQIRVTLQANEDRMG